MRVHKDAHKVYNGVNTCAHGYTRMLSLDEGGKTTTNIFTRQLLCFVSDRARETRLFRLFTYSSPASRHVLLTFARIMSPNSRFLSRFFSRDRQRSQQLVNTDDEINIDEQSTSDEQILVPQPTTPTTTTTATSTRARSSPPSIVKRYERNYASASCSMFAIAALAVSLSDYRWFWLNGGLCNSKFIGLSMFFAVGKLFVVRVPVPWDPSAPISEIYQFKPNDYMGTPLPSIARIVRDLCLVELTGCVDTRSILILRLIITLICLAIFSSTIGFLLDALGPMKYGLKFMRRHAFWHILSGSDRMRTNRLRARTAARRVFSAPLYSSDRPVLLGLGADLRYSRPESREDRQEGGSSIRRRLLPRCDLQRPVAARVGVRPAQTLPDRRGRTLG